MSVNAVVWLYKTEIIGTLKPNHQAVVVRMAWRAREDADDWLEGYGVAQIAAEVGCSRDVVMKAIDAAENAGILFVERSHRKRSTYRFRVPKTGRKQQPNSSSLGRRNRPELVENSDPYKNKNLYVDTSTDLVGYGNEPADFGEQLSRVQSLKAKGNR